MRFALLFLLLAGSAAQACQGLDAKDPWIRAAPPGSDMTAGYADLVNHGRKALRITGVATPAFHDAEIHRTTLENGRYGMAPEPVLELAPGARVSLAPEGRHLMLMQATGTLRSGDRVPVSFSCGRHTSTFTFIVRAEP